MTGEPQDHGLSPAFAPPPTSEVDPPPVQEPGDFLDSTSEEPSGFRQRIRSRLSREMRDAMIDPSDQPTGDFDIVADQMSSSRGDRVAGFSSLITAMRLATVAISLLLAASTNQLGTSLRIWTAIVVGYAVFRAFKPVVYDDDVRSLVRVMAEVGLHVVAVIYTGGWDSPLIFTLFTPIALAGLARGFGFAIRIAVAAVIAVTWPYVLDSPDRREALITSASWGSIVLIVAVISGYRAPHFGRGSQGTRARPRPAWPTVGRQHPAVLAAPGHPDAARLAGPRRCTGFDPLPHEVARVL